MPKSYKITIAEYFDPHTVSAKPVSLTRQLTIPGTVPGPETTIRKAVSSISFDDFRTFEIQHEYQVNMWGRSFEDGRQFSSFIARGEIRAYHSSTRGVLLLSGKKADIIDFCKQSQTASALKLETIQLDMKALQQKLPEIRGVWFRFKTGYIRAKAYMGQQIQDTTEFSDANVEGDISTLSFYFEDARDGCMHPLMITEDGAVVLQKNYKSIEDEIDFVLHVKTELLDSLFTRVDPTKVRGHVSMVEG